MNRELKFRIFDKNDTKGIIGPFAWNKLPQFFYPENFIVMQYTGLKDRNNKEIYEGDLVNFSIDYTVELGDKDIIQYNNMEVYYDNELAGFFFGKPNSDYQMIYRQSDFQMLDGIMKDTLEVVGNIYEKRD